MHSCSKKEKGGGRSGGMRLRGAPGGRQGQEAHSCGGGHCH